MSGQDFGVFSQGEAYIIRHTEFLKNCQLEMMVQCLNVQAITRGILQRDDLCYTINVLGIGSGSGNPDIEIVKIIKEELQRSELHRHTKIHSVSVEPNECFFRHFQESLHKLPSWLRDGTTTFDFHTKSFEDFKAEYKCSTKFHIIHFVHSIYFLELEKALKYCFDDLLLENGKIVVTVTAKTDLTYLLCLKQGHMTPSGEPVSTDQVLEVVKKHGWKYQENFTESIIDVTGVFDEDSIDGNYLLDFMTQKMNFRANSDQKQITETMNMIKELTTTENGRRVGKKVDATFTIEK